MRLLRRRRAERLTPSYYKFGQSRTSPVCYKIQEIEDWIQTNRVNLEQSLYATHGITGSPT